MNQVKESLISYKEEPSKQRLRLAYLDGIRGLASLYVVLVHSYFDPGSALLWLPVTYFLRYGIFAVVIFIVLSGYCLMLPIVRSKRGSLSGGLLGFFMRRIRRILPPYYTALFFCMLIGGVTLLLKQASVFGWADIRLDALNGLFSPVFSFRDVFIYFLFIQNFGLHNRMIDGPTWTIAVEWQIYFVFAVLLIPIWRRLGLLFTAMTAFVIGLALNYLMGSELSSHVCPWFIGLFALGMAAAEINFSRKPSMFRLRSLPWEILAVTFASLAFFTEWLRFRLNEGLPEWIVHYCVALGTACFLIYCTNILISGKTFPPVLKLLESRWLVALGIFSYSLYITHAPVVWLVQQFLLSQQLSPTMMAAQSFLIAVPLSLIIAYLFHCAFERPFMSHFSFDIKSRKGEYKGFPKSSRGWNVFINGEQIGTQTEFATSLKKLLEWLREYMSVDTVTLLLPIIDRQNLAVYTTLGLEEEIVQQILIPVGKGFAGRIAANGEPMIVDNLNEIEVVSPVLRQKGLRSLVGIPLPIKQSEMGVLHLGTFQSHKFTERDVRELQLVANLIKSMIEDTSNFKVENSLHQLDISFGEDEYWIGKDLVSENFAILDWLLVHLVGCAASHKRGLKIQQFLAVMDNAYLTKVLAA
ncbi:MAG: acyltransferase family protein [Chroococcidiopsidaceae cyanobacterium CP_BM_RX_35]|nr:acyltransferase family protein [Chroococcidiopsidaceae cyanobacterium CP_BM_RX_35]